MMGPTCVVLVMVCMAVLVAASHAAAASEMPAATLATGGLRLPAIFADHMVLQQGIKVPVWGWAAAGDKVAVTLGDQKAAATAGKDGRWQVALEPMKAGGGPMEMTVSVAGSGAGAAKSVAAGDGAGARAGASTITVRDILVGEVWVCSGQSNMEMALFSARDAGAEVAAANYPKIRMFTVKRTFAAAPQSECDGSWDVCSPRTAGAFSAVGYFFGRDVHKATSVPVGLIHTSWGGTVAEAWTSRAGLEAAPDLQPIVKRAERLGHVPPAEEAAFKETLAKWEDVAYLKDSGNKGFGKGWAKADLDDADWKSINTPGTWESLLKLDIDGAVWFRKSVQIPAAWAGKELDLSIGAVDDFDTTYFNNEKVGAMGREVPFWWMAERKYRVPASMVKAGKAMVAVRVFDQFMGGGLTGPAPQMFVAPVGAAEPDRISLAGPWKFKIEFEAPGQRPTPPYPIAPAGTLDQNAPTALYNSMLAPVIPFGIRGVIWYQGESNADRAYQYRKLFPAMITDWRRLWGEGDFPFLFVQLANYEQRAAEPGPSNWAELREAQTMTLSLPKTGMAVAIDIGEAADIHPKNKQDVGGRLAVVARSIAGEEVFDWLSPMYDSMKVEGGRIRVKFSGCGVRATINDQRPSNPLIAGRMTEKGFKATREKLTGFSIAGEDKKFVWADAIIDPASADTVIVSSPKVAKPVAVRYGWANNPECNLYNVNGLPASPFRTDDWPGITVKNK